MNRELLQKIDSMIEALSAPVSALEAADGWTPQCKLDFLKFYSGLKQKLKSGEPLPQYTPACRAMDFKGVTGGELCDLSCEIDGILRTLRTKNQ